MILVLVAGALSIKNHKYRMTFKNIKSNSILFIQIHNKQTFEIHFKFYSLHFHRALSFSCVLLLLVVGSCWLLVVGDDVDAIFIDLLFIWIWPRHPKQSDYYLLFAELRTCWIWGSKIYHWIRRWYGRFWSPALLVYSIWICQMIIHSVFQVAFELIIMEKY